jgi:hypothetical protein
MEDAGAGGGGHRRSAGGTAGGLLRIPGIARDAAEAAVGNRLPAEFGRRRLSDEDGAGSAQQGNGGGILVIGGGSRRPAAVTHAPALDPDDVLQRRRYAVGFRQRLACPPAFLGSTCGLDRTLAVDHGESVEKRIDRFGAIQRRQRHLDGRQRSSAVGGAKLRSSQATQIIGVGNGRQPIRHAVRTPHFMAALAAALSARAIWRVFSSP